MYNPAIISSITNIPGDMLEHLDFQGDLKMEPFGNRVRVVLSFDVLPSAPRYPKDKLKMAKILDQRDLSRLFGYLRDITNDEPI